MKRKFFALALFLLMLISLTSCGETTQDQENSPPASSQPKEQTPDTTPAADENKEAETETESEDLPDERGIIGSHGTDIRMGLTQFGLEEAAISPAPEEAREIFASSSSTSYQDSSLGVTFDYSLTMDRDFQIIGASFGITNNSASKDDFVIMASTYLGFSATMPYDAGEPANAKDWVIESIEKGLNEGENAITIGDAKFELFGTEIGDGIGNIWMDVSKVVG